MILTLAIALALSVGAQGDSCFAVEVFALGRSGHGATILPQAAPHRLIRALDRLPRWVAGSEEVRSGRIVGLRAAPAINVIPSRATARIEVVIEAGSEKPETTVESLRLALGTEVEVRLTDGSCVSDSSAASDS